MVAKQKNVCQSLNSVWLMHNMNSLSTISMSSSHLVRPGHFEWLLSMTAQKKCCHSAGWSPLLCDCVPVFFCLHISTCVSTCVCVCTYGDMYELTIANECAQVRPGEKVFSIIIHEIWINRHASLMVDEDDNKWWSNERCRKKDFIAI